VHYILKYKGGFPASGPLWGTAGQEVFFVGHQNRRGGVPSGAAAFIAVGNEGALLLYLTKGVL